MRPVSFLGSFTLSPTVGQLRRADYAHDVTTQMEPLLERIDALHPDIKVSYESHHGLMPSSLQSDTVDNGVVEVPTESGSPIRVIIPKHFPEPVGEYLSRLVEGAEFLHEQIGAGVAALVNHPPASPMPAAMGSLSARTDALPESIQITFAPEHRLVDRSFGQIPPEVRTFDEATIQYEDFTGAPQSVRITNLNDTPETFARLLVEAAETIRDTHYLDEIG